MKILTEQDITRAISEVLSEALNERGTNMDSLYHFTVLDVLPDILKHGCLNTSERQMHQRNGKMYISFTRHKSAKEGFAAEEGCNVRIEADGHALSTVRGSDVYPYEYYSPKRPWAQKLRKMDSKSAKSRYQGAKKMNVYGAGYMNQAEESFETKSPWVNLEKVAKTIDILLNAEDRFASHDMASLEKCVATNSPLLDITRVYESERDFNLQTGNCIPIRNYLYSRKRAAEE